MVRRAGVYRTGTKLVKDGRITVHELQPGGGTNRVTGTVLELRIAAGPDRHPDGGVLVSLTDDRGYSGDWHLYEHGGV